MNDIVDSNREDINEIIFGKKKKMIQRLKI